MKSALARRWFSVEVLSSGESTNEEYRMDTNDQEISFNQKFLFMDIGKFTEMCKWKCNPKYLTTLLYM